MAAAVQRKDTITEAIDSELILRAGCWAQLRNNLCDVTRTSTS